MTVEINLLPWREARRLRRSRRLSVALGLAVALALGSGYGVSWYYGQEVRAQQQRNAHIQAKSRQLDAAIRQVGELEAGRGQLLERVRALSMLQVERAQTAHVMRDLTTSLVDGVHYTRLGRQGEELQLSGSAETHWQVSDQLRALAAAAAFTEPVLSEVEAVGDGGQRRFSLSMRQQMPVAEADSGESP